MIPRILHQTWKTRTIPDEWREARRSWLDAHPRWTHRFWTDDDLERLVRGRAPDLYPSWREYPDQIQRVDAARYVILREEGGVYADLDMVCLRPLDPLLRHELVLPRTRPLGLSNQLMAARPGHPLLDRAVRRLPRAYRRWQRPWIPRHFRVLLTTGPLFLTKVYHTSEGVGGRRTNGGPPAGDGADRRPLDLGDVRILTLDEHGHGDLDRSYVRHLRGRSWAEWDTHLFNFVHDHWRLLAGAAVTGAAALGLMQ